MTTKKFMCKLLIYLVVFTIVSILVVSIEDVFNALVSNQLAINQMENDDAAFVFIQMYQNTIKPIVSILFIVISLIIASIAIRDIYKFIKIKKVEKNKNEEDNIN